MSFRGLASRPRLRRGMIALSGCRMFLRLPYCACGAMTHNTNRTCPAWLSCDHVDVARQAFAVPLYPRRWRGDLTVLNTVALLGDILPDSPGTMISACSGPRRRWHVLAVCMVNPPTYVSDGFHALGSRKAATFRPLAGFRLPLWNIRVAMLQFALHALSVPLEHRMELPDFTYWTVLAFARRPALFAVLFQRPAFRFNSVKSSLGFRAAHYP